MSETYDNELSGVLFRNNRQREGKQDPPYQGQCMINGKDYWINAWVNTSKKDGSKFFGLKFKLKVADPTVPSEPAPDEDSDLSVPF